MMYSNIRSQAGLAALVFIVISVSLVSAAPIPISASIYVPLPHRNLSPNGQETSSKSIDLTEAFTREVRYSVA
jgi:hypothetical protein